MMNIRKIAAALAAAAGLIAIPATAHASTQFTALAESRTVLVTPAHLSLHETIHLGLDGQSFTVATESFNGGGTVFTVSPVLPKNDVGQNLLFTA